MGEVVLGVGASHTTLMNTHWDAVEDVGTAIAFRDALYRAAERIRRAEPDTVIIIGSNHFRGFWLDLLPAFTIGVGECVASGESGTPEGPQTVDTGLARWLCTRLIEEGFDPAFSVKLQIDHGISHAIQYLLAGLEVPIVPHRGEHVRPTPPDLAALRADGIGDPAGGGGGSGRQAGGGDRVGRTLPPSSLAPVVRPAQRGRRVHAGGVDRGPG